jgi:hypothetical protein
MEHTPYTYLIGWSKHNKYYYGVRFAKNCHPSDLWTKYFTSSKHVTEFRIKHGEPDVIQIRKTFNNKQTAQLWEHCVLTRLNAYSNPRLLNQTNNKCWNNTDDHYKKMAVLNSHPKSEQTKQKLSAAYTPERREKSRKLFQSTSYSKIYEITFPDQHVEVVDNIIEFCKVHNLSRTTISTLANGNWVSDTYKGFKATIIGKTSKPRTRQEVQSCSSCDVP